MTFAQKNQSQPHLCFPHHYLSPHFLHFLCLHPSSENACESKGRVPTPVTKALEMRFVVVE
jgi:hypothetical protein